ncbi:MAG: beta-glucanase (GH16 family) [Cyclobacteriaceae bacterium]|jgi:beta-glucanase (GH16 family)
MAMKNVWLLLSFLSMGMLFSCGEGDDNPGTESDVPEGYTIIWQDEFDETAINATNWDFENGDGTDFGLPAGWGNNELQLYTGGASNANIETDGDLSVLKLTAVADGAGGYTSSKVVTKDKFSMRFGRVDVRAKLPTGQGVWPAIWMLGDNISEVDWPGCGEIDIVEMLGDNSSKVYSTVHFTNNELKREEQQGTYELASGSFNDDYHKFSLTWTPESMTFFVDDTQMHEVIIADDMKEFLRSFYLIMNVAVGGNWPGYPDETTAFPQSMMVDYIRVYEKNDFEAPAAPPLDLDEESLGGSIGAEVAANGIQDGFILFDNVTITAFGAGGEPAVTTSSTAINGDSSLAFTYPGGTWGGAYMELFRNVNASQYTHLKFSLQKPENLVDAEIKLESTSTDAALFLINYTGTEVANGFVEYSIPLADFEGLDLTDLRIPFSMWNPLDADLQFVEFTVLIDNIYLSE